MRPDNQMRRSGAAAQSIIPALLPAEECIFFYDGECGFCNSFVLFLLDRTEPGSLKFSSLQNDFSARFFAGRDQPKPDLRSAVLFCDKQFYRESSAVLKALQLCNAPFGPLAGALLLVPELFRNWVYKVVARMRRALPEIKPHCRCLTKAERARFILDARRPDIAGSC